MSNKDQEKVFLHAMSLTKDSYNGSGEIYKTFKQNGIINIMDIFALTKYEIKDLIYEK